MRIRLFLALIWFGSVFGLSVAGVQPPATGGGAAAETPKPPTPTLLPDKAIEKFRMKDVDGCYEELRKAAAGHPMAPHPRVQLALLFYEARDGQNARLTLEKAAAEDPDHPDVYLTNASFAYGETRVTDAILNLSAALRSSENPRWNATQRSRFERDARIGLAACYEFRTDWASAKEHVDALIKADGKNTAFRQRLGNLYFQLGKHEEAFAAFALAFKDDPTVDPPELRMGLLWAGKNDSSKTEDWLKKAIAAHAKDARVHRGYAVIMLNDRKLPEADQNLKTAESLAPTARDTLFLRGLYHRYMKANGEAEKIFDDLSRKFPADIEVSINLALSLAESTDKVKQQRGVDMAETVVRQAPKQAGGYEILGWCYYKIGRLDDAEKSLGTAASGGRLSLDGAYFLSRVLFDRGKYEDVYKILKEAKDTKGPAVYRDELKKLYDDAEKKVPKEKKEEKKDDRKEEKK